MNKKQFLRKVKEMIKDMEKDCLEKAKLAFDSGAFDPESYEDNFILPKIFMSAYGERIKWNYQPHSKEHIGERNNLQHFI